MQICCLSVGPVVAPEKVPIPENKKYQCGVVNPDNGWRITSGSPAAPGQFPWQVSLHFTGQHVCGGTLINEDTIVTAAHCVGMPYGTLPGLWAVVIGTTNIANPKKFYQVNKVYKHATWEEFRGDDIAIMKLAENVPFSEHVIPACLPRHDPAPGDICYVSGWGQTSTTGDPNEVTPKDLLFVPIRVVDPRICSQLFDKLDQNNICAGGHTSQNGCRGDSGGPFVCNRQGKWYVHGVVSFGTVPCGQLGQPGVYTRVSAFVDWIMARS